MIDITQIQAYIESTHVLDELFGQNDVPSRKEEYPRHRRNEEQLCTSYNVSELEQMPKKQARVDRASVHLRVPQDALRRMCRP